MRRLLALLLAVVFCTLCGCQPVKEVVQSQEDREYVKQSSVNLNYNNTHIDMAGYWLTEEAIYYTGSPLGSSKLSPIYYYRTAGNKTEELIRADTQLFTWAQTYADTMYMLDMDMEHSDKALYRLRSYNLSDNSVEDYGLFELVKRFFVLGDDLYIVTTEDEYFTQSLERVSLKTKERTVLASSILDAGVIGDQPAYIAQNGTTYRVYTCDVAAGSSQCLGSFECAFSEEEEWMLFNANITSDAVLVTINRENGSRLLQYRWETDKLTEYKWDAQMDILVAYEDYAFAVTIGEEQSPLHRICLADGTKETIANIPGRAEIFVTSDTDVYVSSSEDGDIIRYNSAGEQELVCDF